jgi:AraC-like DNA-binding protein
LDSNLVRLGIITHSLIYIIISFRYLKVKSIKLSTVYNMDNIDDFMKFILLCYVLLWIVNVQIFAIIKYITFAKWCAYVSSLYALSVFIFINGLVFLAYCKPNIFVLKLKYANNNLEPATKDLYFTQLMNFMITNKPYLEPVFTLSKLSNETNIPSKFISQIVNDKLNQNYSDFINCFRIEESKIYLSDPEMDCLTIQEIYYKSGFNSKSTFNLVFKKHTGLTPLKYRKCRKS